MPPAPLRKAFIHPVKMDSGRGFQPKAYTGCIVLVGGSEAPFRDWGFPQVCPLDKMRASWIWGRSLLPPPPSPRRCCAPSLRQPGREVAPARAKE